jgi:hypothetical protein
MGLRVVNNKFTFLPSTLLLKNLLKITASNDDIRCRLTVLHVTEESLFHLEMEPPGTATLRSSSRL